MQCKLRAKKTNVNQPEFMKDRAELVKLKWRKKLKDNAGDNFFLNVEEIGKTFNDLMIRTQTTLGRPLVNLGSTVGKWVFSASVLSRMAGRVLLVTLLSMGLVNIGRYFWGGDLSFVSILSTVMQNRFYQLFLAFALVFNVRHILFRLRDRDVGKSG